MARTNLHHSRNQHEETVEQRSFRLVCQPEEREAVLALLAAQGVDVAREPFSPWCCKATKASRPLGSTLAAWFGLIYIQDRASMLSPLALEPHVRGTVVLDMCSSPGGKSSFLASLAGPEGFVLANEPNRQRHQTLKRNLARLQLPNAGVCQYPGESVPMPDASWPCILLDPPCSGWGTTDKHPSAKRIWQGEKIAPLASLQRKLLTEAARLLSPGGWLAYSTCTTNAQENEEQMCFAVEELGLVLDPMPEPGGFVFEAPHDPACHGCLRVDEDQSQAQGHFIARLRKPGSASPAPCNPMPGEPLPDEALENGPRDWATFGQGELRVFGENVHFVHRLAGMLPPALHWQGLQVGRLARGIFRPLPRTRGMLPKKPSAGDLVTDDPTLLLRLVQGQSLEAPGSGGGACGLYFRAADGERPLPLGWGKRKGNRMLWAER